MFKKLSITVFIVLLMNLLLVPLVLADTPDAATNAHAIDTVWTLIAAFLVFFMQAGFAMLEAGFSRAKNVGNIIMKNIMDFSVGSIAYWLFGFGIMFGASHLGIFGTESLLLNKADPAKAEGLWQFAYWMFHVVFCATAATIVSGAMAERTRFTAYLIYSFFISAFIYPIVGHWIWGGGWLAKLGMVDFAGSTVVHSVGGWTALSGALLLGPRTGKYGPNGQSRIIQGHSMALAALGVFILWFGWFGFNPGSTTAGTNLSIAIIAVTTNLAAAAGAITAMFTVWFHHGKPDISMTLNGALAGLVAITAPSATVSPGSAIIIGAIAGILVVFSVEFIDQKLHIDDPVGAISVHGVCGAWGTLSVGLFSQAAFGQASGVGAINGLFFGGGIHQLLIQLLGVATVFVWVGGTSLLMFYFIKNSVGLRVSRDEELKGLDIGEHGIDAYSGFQIFATE